MHSFPYSSILQEPPSSLPQLLRGAFNAIKVADLDRFPGQLRTETTTYKISNWNQPKVFHGRSNPVTNPVPGFLLKWEKWFIETLNEAKKNLSPPFFVGPV